ncbi:cytochrome P450 [Streptomyces sp. NPDC056500]|uniref:cytochrome P450 n=1 Tax=Streptomyces sp. NPDC056500 TaxID=3345840 RepID=UPI0036BDCDC3
MSTHLETVPLAPGALPGIGHLGRLARDPLGFFERLRAHGPLVRIRLAHRTVYVVSSAELVHHVLVTGRADYDKGGPVMDTLRALLGNGMPMQSDALQHVQRPLIQPAFHRDRMPDYIRRLTAYVEKHIAGWEAGQVLDGSAEMSDLITASLTLSLFTDPVSARAAIRFKSDLPIILSGLALRAALPVAARLPLPANLRYNRAAHRTHTAIDTILRHRQDHPGHHDDLLTMFLAARNGLDAKADDEQTRADILGFMTAGIETTADLLGWTLHVLTTRPDLYQSVQNEIDTVLDGSPPAYQDLPRLSQLHQVVTEVLRFHPPVWLLSRITRRPAELGGHTLPPDADIVFSISALHRDPAVFPDPGRFDPSRWQPGRTTRAQKAGFLPFGVGARKCIGDVFGMAEVTSTLVVMLQHYRIRLAPGSKVTPRADMTLRPVGLRLLIEPRTVRTPVQQKDPA